MADGSSANSYGNHYYYPGDSLFGYSLEWSDYNRQPKQDYYCPSGVSLFGSNNLHNLEWSDYNNHHQPKQDNYPSGVSLFGYNNVHHLEWSDYNHHQPKQDYWSSELRLQINEMTNSSTSHQKEPDKLSHGHGGVSQPFKYTRQNKNDEDEDEGDRSYNNWLYGLRMTEKGSVEEELLKAGSICRVPEGIREANKEKREEWYRPKFVAMGPIHRAATIDLQIMESTKWHYLNSLFHRPKHPLLSSRQYHNLNLLDCSRAIQKSEGIIRACYGHRLDMKSQEFSTMMLLDACFLLELLLWLRDDLTDGSTKKFIPDYIDDSKKMSRLDLTLLENQIPFYLLNVLSRILITSPKLQQQQVFIGPLNDLLDNNKNHRKLSPRNLDRFLFNRHVQKPDHDDEFPIRIYHFLHLIHWCTPDPYDPKHYQGQAPLQLHYCARELQALGIQIRTTPHEPAAVKNNNNNMTYEEVEKYMEKYFQIDFNAEERNNNTNNNNKASVAIEEFMDKFEFKIDFNAEGRELIIPTLHIKETTEIKWRNFIAWEQIGRLIGVGYKFTSYAYFFKALVCSVDDIQLLKYNGVIRAHPDAKDEELLIMFQSLVTGATHMDARYNKECEILNKGGVSVGVGGSWVYRSLLHYWLRFVEWLHRILLRMLRSFKETYLGRTPWKLIGVISAVVLLVLTLTQTIFAGRQSK